MTSLNSRHRGPTLPRHSPKSVPDANAILERSVKQLVGAETAQRLRLLKANLEDEPLDL